MRKLKKARKAIKKLQIKYKLPVDESSIGKVTFETFDMLYTGYGYKNSYATYTFAIDTYGEENLAIQLYDNVLIPYIEMKVLFVLACLLIVIFIIIELSSIFIF